MHIDVRCSGCNAEYRINAANAGRRAVCKHCGQQFTVPHPSEPEETPEFEDDALAFREEPPPPRAPSRPAMRAAPRPSEIDVDDAPESDGPPDLSAVFDIKEPSTPAPVSRRRFSGPLLPPIVSDLILPIIVGLGCIALAGDAAVSAAMDSHHPTTGFILMGIAALLFLVVVVPLTQRAMQAGGSAFKLRLPNVIGMQTFSLALLPIVGGTLGYFNGGTSTAIGGAVLGLIAMIGLGALMIGADPLCSAGASACAAMGAAGATALATAVAFGIGFVMLKAGVRMPWDDRVEVAAAVKHEVPPPAEVAKPAEPVQPLKEVAPAPVVTVAPKPVIVHTEPTYAAWKAAPDAAPDALKWGTLPAESRFNLEGTPPMTLLAASPTSPFAAVICKTVTNVYDLRNTHKVGYIHDVLSDMPLTLSPDGKLMVVGRLSPDAMAAIAARARSRMPSPMGAVSMQPTLLEVWSTAENKILTRIGGASALPDVIGFAGDALVTVSPNGGSAVQVWDVNTGVIRCGFDLPAPRSKTATVISPTGKYLITPGKQRLCVFDLATGQLAGELPETAGPAKAVAFSPNGAELAALVDATHGTTAGMQSTQAGDHLMIWSMTGGKLVQDTALPSLLGAGARVVAASFGTPTASAMQPANPAMARIGPTKLLSAEVPALSWLPEGDGLEIGNDLIERESGHMVYTLAPQVSGNLSGSPCALLSGDKALYEFLPSPTAERVMYKVVALPKAQIEQAMANARAAAPPRLAATDESPSVPLTAPAAQ